MADQPRLSFEGRPPDPVAPALRARTRDPETSHASMAAFDPETMTSAMAVVVRLFRVHGLMADFELRAAFHAAWTAPCCDHLYRQARSSARDQGLVRDTGRRVPNPTTRRQQIVWEAADQEPPILERCPTCGHVTRVKGLDA